jgi:hypothetical protein
MSPADDKTAAQSAHFLEAKESGETPLPSPVSASAFRAKPKLSTSVIIPVWITISSAVIIYNNYLYNTLNFKYPVFLVTFHLAFAVRVTSLNDSCGGLTDRGRRWAPACCSARHTFSTASRTCQ